MSPFEAREAHYWRVTALLGSLPVLAVCLLAGFLLYNGVAAPLRLGLATFTTGNWLPFEGLFGLLPLLVGTLATTLAALLLSLPLGLGVALHTSLFSGARFRRLADSAVALLAGLPSVVIGLWGMTWILPRLGNSFASATLVLALMILPTFILLAGAALRQVPAELVETVRALGVGEQVVAWTVLRHARVGLVGAATLACCRGLGEAVALSMVAGNVPAMPELLGPVATLTTTLIIEYDGAAGNHRAALYLLALVVMSLIAVTSLAARKSRVTP